MKINLNKLFAFLFVLLFLVIAFWFAYDSFLRYDKDNLKGFERCIYMNKA